MLATSRRRQLTNPAGHIAERETAFAFREFTEHHRLSISLLAEMWGESEATVQRVLTGRVALTEWRTNLLPGHLLKLWCFRKEETNRKLGVEQ